MSSLTPTPLVLRVDSSGDSSTFALISRNGQNTSFVDIGSAPEAPWKLNISHRVEGKGSATRQAHTVTISRVNIDSAGVAQDASVSFTVRRSNSPAITDVIVQELVGQLIDLLTDKSLTTLPATAAYDNLRAIMRGASE